MISNFTLRVWDKARSRWQAMRPEAENHQTGHRTIVQLDKFTANVGVEDRIFTTRSLEK